VCLLALADEICVIIIQEKEKTSQENKKTRQEDRSDHPVAFGVATATATELKHCPRTTNNSRDLQF
jgi:hypothetical protein